MIVLPDIRTYLNSYIDSTSNNVLLIFPNSRSIAIYKKYFFPRRNEILICIHNIKVLDCFKKHDGIRFKEYEFIGFDDLKQKILKRFENEILNGTSNKEPRGLLDITKNKSVKYKPRNKKHSYTGLQEHHIIVDEIHEWSGINE